VHPDFQARGLGRVLLVSWTQRIRDSGIAERVALICRERYIGFYENAGFRKVGESKCQYGGGGWYDMVMEFSETSMDDED
jgi:ribosomal protein S18 acetylase RimI-like enzyme